MGIEFKAWKGNEVIKLARLTAAKRLEAAAILLQNDIKQRISEPSNHGTSPSAAGDSPHKDSGRLRASISHEIDPNALKARVGTNVVYGKFLELGTVKMQARPFIRPALAENLTKIKQIIGGK